MLKLQYFGHLILRANFLEKTLMLGKIEGKRREQQRMRWLESIIDSMDKNLRKLWDIVKDREAAHSLPTWHTCIASVVCTERVTKTTNP